MCEHVYTHIEGSSVRIQGSMQTLYRPSGLEERSLGPDLWPQRTTENHVGAPEEQELALRPADLGRGLRSTWLPGFSLWALHSSDSLSLKQAWLGHSSSAV